MLNGPRRGMRAYVRVCVTFIFLRCVSASVTAGGEVRINLAAELKE